jgi:hypothetical protein
MQHWEQLAELDRGGFRIIVDKTWDDVHPRDCFEEADVEEICDKIDRGIYEWFVLRVRVFVDDIELSREFLGGCCYEDAREVLTDGVGEDIIEQALYHARQQLTPLAQKFTMLAMKHSEGVE